MSYIDPIADEKATGLLRELYDGDLQADGYISNVTRAFSRRPDVYAALRDTMKKLRAHMRLRRYELVTLAAAYAQGCKF